MKIIHVVESFAGGVYDFVATIVNAMSQYEHIVIYSRREFTPHEFYPDFPETVQFLYWGATREIRIKHDVKAFLELVHILKTFNDYDIIHLHSSKAGFLGRVAARVLGKQNKVIYTPHGVSFLREDISQKKKKLFIWLERIASVMGGKVVACSHSEAKEFQKKNIKASFVNNGLDLKPYIYPKIKKLSKVIIGTVGRITLQKNPALFNNIAKNFCTHHNLEFRWVGDGEYRSQLDSPNISVSGWKTQTEVVNELSEIDIYLSTSLWEGLPLSVIQAMASGLPLVLSKCTGNTDMIEEGRNGYLFCNIEESIKYLSYLVDNPSLRNEFGIQSRKIANIKFTSQQMICGYELEYKSCFSGQVLRNL